FTDQDTGGTRAELGRQVDGRAWSEPHGHGTRTAVDLDPVRRAAAGQVERGRTAADIERQRLEQAARQVRDERPRAAVQTHVEGDRSRNVDVPAGPRPERVEERVVWPDAHSGRAAIAHLHVADRITCE